MGILERELESIVGKDAVLTDEASLLRYSKDLWPRGFLQPWAHLPRAVIRPAGADQVAAVLGKASEYGVAVVPYGGGSGVCAAVSDGPGHLCIETSRLVGIDVDAGGMTVRAGAGVRGGVLDRNLRDRNPPLTTGHYPASLEISSVGGWVGTSSSGQESTRYGSIADIVIRLELALPDGSLCTLEGDDARDIVGSEGTLGLVTEAELRLHLRPQKWHFASYRFASMEQGIEAMRKIIDVGLRPNVLRLYDGVDAALSLSGDGTESGGGGPSAWQVRALRASQLLSRLVAVAQRARLLRPVLVVVTGDPGSDKECDIREVGEVARSAGGDCMGEDQARGWHRHRFRFDDAYMTRIYQRGALVNTLDFWASWALLAELTRRVVEALRRRCLAMAHISHCGPDGACLYVTYLGACRNNEAALRTYDWARNEALETAVGLGAKITHQHGVGLEKLSYFVASDPDRHKRLRQLKSRFDPSGIMNPGKLAI